jgi:hypothetical protein
MSKGQESQPISSAQQIPAQEIRNAQTAFIRAQGDANSISKALGEFAGAYPYGIGVVYQTSKNEVLGDASDAAALAAGIALVERGDALRGNRKP